MQGKKKEGNKYRDKGCVCNAQEYIFIINPAIFFFNVLTSCQTNLTTVVVRNFSSKCQLNQGAMSTLQWLHCVKKIYKVNCSGGVLIHPWELNLSSSVCLEFKRWTLSFGNTLAMALRFSFQWVPQYCWNPPLSFVHHKVQIIRTVAIAALGIFFK